MFGGNPLADERNVALVEELAGVARLKPFECVGEPDEVLAALWLLRRDGRFLDAPAMRVMPDVADGESLVARVLAPSSEHLIPPPFDEILHAAL